MESIKKELDGTALKSTISELLMGIKREGMGDLLWFLDHSDFFDAPASSRHHLSVKHGLAMHSINVFNALFNLANEYALTVNTDSLKICALLHDLCKVNCYKNDFKNVKNEKTGIWEKQPFIKWNDDFPLGHGEKSCIMIMKYIKLTDEEIMAIRWHMLAWDVSDAQKESLSLALKQYKLIGALAAADQIATYIME